MPRGIAVPREYRVLLISDRPGISFPFEYTSQGAAVIKQLGFDHTKCVLVQTIGRFETQTAIKMKRTFQNKVKKSPKNPG